MLTLALKIENGVYHVLQGPRSSQGAFLGHVADDKGCDIVGLGNLHKLIGHFTDLTDRTLHARNVRAHNGLDRVDNQEIWLDFLNLSPNALHIGLRIEIELAVNVAQTLRSQLNLLGRLFPDT